MNKKYVYGVSVLLIIILAIVFLLNFQQSILRTGGVSSLPPETRTVNWKDNVIELEAPYFGSLTSGEEYPYGTSDNQDYIICGDNDGKITISNSFNSNNELVLYSSGNGRDGKGCNGNYIEAEVTLPPGTLKVSCNLVATDTRDWGASSYCKVNGLLSESVESRGKPPRFYIDGGTKTKSVLREFEIEEQQTLTFETGGNFGSDNSYSTDMIIDFTPSSLPEPPTTEKPTWTNIWHKISDWFNDLIKRILNIE